MPRESQETRLTRYRSRVQSARTWRENKGYVETWKRMIDMYRGRQWEKPPDSEAATPDMAMVNMAFAVHNVVLAAVTTQYPKFTVSPNNIGFDDQATVAEAVLNYAWKHYNFHSEFQAAVNDMSMLGHGWLKVGWRYKEQTQDLTLTPEEQFARVATGQARADQLAAQGSPELAGQLPTDEELAASVTPTEEGRLVVEDDPFVERVSPFDVILDPEATMSRDWSWIAQRTIRDLDEVHDDESYDARARHKVQADLSVGAPNDGYGDHRAAEVGGLSEHSEESDRVTVWELYDFKAGEWCVFAADGEGFLVKPAKIPTEGFANPFVMFRDYDVPDTIYPIGEIESIEELQEELNKTRTQQINARKQFVRKFIGREAALNSRAKEALASEIDGDVAFVTDDDRPLTDVIIPAPSLSFDPQLFIAHSSQIVNDMQLTTGLSDYQFGQMPDTRRLATEAMAVEGAVNARSSFKLSKVERTLADVGRMLLAVMQQFMDTVRVGRVAGAGGELLFEYTPDDIQGEFDLNVEAGSTQPKNDMIRRQEAVTLFNTLAPFMGMIVDPQQLITYLLQEGYGIKNVDRFFVGQQPAAPPGMQPPGMQQPGMQPGLPPGLGAPPGQPPGPVPTGNGATPIAPPPVPAGV